MIKAIIFDLDGTLIQTEVLKATSYARAINFLTKCKVSKDRVLDIFGRFVGLSRQEVVGGLAKHFKFELENALGPATLKALKTC
jgi:beta-phosphoglucomutase-like phosphatase (HAD superfamily)